MYSNLQVEQALSLIPHTTEFLPLIDAVIGASRPDRQRTWAKSGKYATMSKRVVDPADLRSETQALAAEARERLQDVCSLVVDAIRAYEAGELEAAALNFVWAGELEEADEDLTEAERLYLLALEVATEAAERRAEIVALRHLGRVAHSAGRFADSQARYERSYLLSVEAQDVLGQAASCQGLGAIWAEQGERAHAHTWYSRGVQLAWGLDPEFRHPFLCQLAALAIRLGELDEAEAQLEHARQAIRAARCEQAMAAWYHQYGLLLDARGDSLGAECTYRKGVEHARDPACEIRIRIDLGHKLLREDRLLEAREEARKAEEIAIRKRSVPVLVEVYGLLGAIARKQCDPDGFVFYEQALELCREQRVPPLREAAVYHEYGLFLHGCGHTAEAPDYLRKASEIYQESNLVCEMERVAADLRALGGQPGRL
ncbi:MAG TPA: tetratricopeptide repeat protein [Longimicrobiaceae bacterium]|nr:tetratricopeptide repeat protein [Longimicrobiaceae bacterium]